MMKQTRGQRGELVRPKKVKRALCIAPITEILLTVAEDRLHITPLEENIAEKWRKSAIREKTDISKWKMGDALYKEVF